MKLCVAGLNHRTAPIAVREQLAFSSEGLKQALADLKQQPGVQEGLILSTCNRVEVAVSAEEHTDPMQSVESFLERSQKLQPDWLRPYLYAFQGRDAVRHIFRVASSLDSMVIGEPQILGQLKSAYTIAREQGAMSGYLDLVVTRAFAVAKRVRTETDIGVSAVSVSYAAVELAREIFGSLKAKRVMLIGAGKMSELAARHLQRAGVEKIWVTNRTLSRANALAGLVGGDIVPYDVFRTRLKDVDIVITSSGAPGYLLTKADMKPILNARKNRPMFLIDIAVPRNVDPAVNELDNLFVYDIDDLQKVVDQNLRARLSEADLADRIVAEEVDRLESWLRTRQLGPLISSLQAQLEALRVAEFERVRSKLGQLTPQQEQAIEALTRGIVNKIAHGPIRELRKHATSDGNSAVIEAVRNIFRLEE